MGKLLFYEDQKKSASYKRELKFVLNSLRVAIGSLLVFAVIAVLEKAAFLGILIATLGIMISCVYSMVILLPGRSVYVYSNKIICKTGLSKARIIELSPNEYSLRLVPIHIYKARRVKLIFEDENKTPLLVYRSALIFLTYKEIKNVWEYDITSIGCKITDETRGIDYER